MCTVVFQREPRARSRILAVRDEFISRKFDDPGAWWPTQAGVVGGRDALSGGTWCVTDVPTGRTAVVLNRVGRQTGQPSRGLLPLAALTGGRSWAEHLDHRQMAGFTLILDTPEGATAWSWDTNKFSRLDLSDGIHLVTAAGVDEVDAKSLHYRPRFASELDWSSVVRAERYKDDLDALVVRHQMRSETYATVFVQSISALPGELVIEHTRHPQEPRWTRDEWSVGPEGGAMRRRHPR